MSQGAADRVKHCRTITVGEMHKEMLANYEYCLEQIKQGDPRFAIGRLEGLIKQLKKEIGNAETGTK